MIVYFTRYEERYDLPIQRAVKVGEVVRDKDCLTVRTDRGNYPAGQVVSATGTWSNPYIPEIPGRSLFEGLQLHSAHYRSPDGFAGKAVLVVGGGNSGAQILAELFRVAKTTWVTLKAPLFLPDDVDDRVLFERATARLKAGPGDVPVGGIGDIVMVPPVKEARARNVLHAVRPFQRMTFSGVVWDDGTETKVDAVWCTDFQAALDHLAPLQLGGQDGRVEVEGQHAKKEPCLWPAGWVWRLVWTRFGHDHGRCPDATGDRPTAGATGLTVSGADVHLEVLTGQASMIRMGAQQTGSSHSNAEAAAPPAPHELSQALPNAAPRHLGQT